MFIGISEANVRSDFALSLHAACNISGALCTILASPVVLDIIFRPSLLNSRNGRRR